MRLFIAINLNNETKKKLLSLRDELRSRASSGSFSFPENLHLTLAFLGECDKKQTTAAIAAMDPLRFEPFELLIERVGRFGRGGSDEAIWWAGVQVNEPLRDLYRKLTSNLASAGFILDKRGFSPHITLGRRVVTEASPWRIEPFGEAVRKIDLMKSERPDGKLTYTSIFNTGCASPRGL